MTDYKELYDKYQIRPDVLNEDDIMSIVKPLAGHPRLARMLIRFLWLDKVNRAHAACCYTPGPKFTERILFEQFHNTLRIDGQEVLDNLPSGPFITVSNHPFGALDGIVLIYLIASRRPEYKVMVNMFLNHISAMRPNFIAVDPFAQTDPAKRSVSVNGIRQALRQLADGNPVGFFPAGAISKTDWHWRLQDRPWQESVLQIISRAKVPVIPIFFHGGNSLWFNILGHICWPARTLRLPSELFRKNGKEIHISVGQPISAEEQALHNSSPAELGKFLRERTFSLRNLR
ncbi:MAG: lysophospholipid acyltransferase family protein [Muribaculaceae bacterium]|nr:lysophospholipid acyltransferase family protein [Muribaculaceae bacterium]